MKVYVVTSTELGWDCVVGVYLSLELAKHENKGENYIFTEKIINEKEYIEKQVEDTSIIKYINEKEAEQEGLQRLKANMQERLHSYKAGLK